MLANFVPLVISLDDRAPASHTLAAIHAEIGRVLAHHQLPFDQIAALAANPSAPDRNPLFDAMIIYHDEAIGSPMPAAQGLVFEEHVVAHHTAKLDLKLDVFPRQDASLELQLEFDLDLYDQALIDRLAHDYLSALRRLIAHEAGPTCALFAPPSTSARSSDSQTLDLCIAASFVAEPLAESLGWWLDQFGVEVTPSFAAYNTVFQSLLDPRSDLRTSAHALILVRPEDWLRDLPSASSSDLAAIIAQRTDLLIEGLDAYDGPSLLVSVAPPSRHPRHPSDARRRARHSAPSRRGSPTRCPSVLVASGGRGALV